MKPSRMIQRAFSVHPDRSAALANVRFVLVGITHPGNIGAIARVMKNMALQNLTLVSSTECGPETEAVAMSSGAYEIVEHAQQVEELNQALADCVMAVAASARIGEKRSAALAPAEVIPQLMETAATGPVACVFGRESKGLSNEEMKLCSHHMIIPTDFEFASMNVAHAAAVTAYEIFRIASRPWGFQARTFRPAAVEEREQMFAHIQEVLIRAGFLNPADPLHMMRDIRRILNSARMDSRDAKIIRGMFRKIGNMIRIADEKVKALEDRLNSI